MAHLQTTLYTEAAGQPPATAPHQLPEVMSSYLLLQVWDRISLQFALRHAADGTIAPLPQHNQQLGELRSHARGRFCLALDPYPFSDDTVTLPITASVVPDRPYSTAEDFLATLSGAAQITLGCTAVRPRQHQLRAHPHEQGDELAALSNPGSAGIFVVGRDDEVYRPQAELVTAAARAAGLDVTLDEVPGEHSWEIANESLARSLPWIAGRTGLLDPVRPTQP